MSRRSRVSKLRSAKSALLSAGTTLAMSFLLSACGPGLGGFMPQRADHSTAKTAQTKPVSTTDDDSGTSTPPPTPPPALPSAPQPATPPTQPSAPTPQTSSPATPASTDPSATTPAAPAAPATPSQPVDPATFAQPSPSVVTPPVVAPPVVAPPVDVAPVDVAPPVNVAPPPIAPAQPVVPAAAQPVVPAAARPVSPTVERNATPPSAAPTPPAPAAPARPSAAPAPPAPQQVAPRPAPQPLPTAAPAAPAAPVAPIAAPTMPPKPPRQHQIDLPPERHDAAIARATVSCEKPDAASCPANVAMLVVRGKNSLAECTAFLIGDSLMMTNSHCVPDEIKTDGADCSANLQAFFPATGAFSAEHVSCKNLVHASKIAPEGARDATLTPDYAIFTLSHAISRPVLTLNRTGLPDNLPLRVFAVDPQSKVALQGLLRVKDCTTAQGTLIVPSFNQAEAPVGTLDACPIIPGNSGSPALDSTGQVRALVHATVAPRTASAVIASGMAPVNQLFHGIGLVTNIACTDIPTSVAAHNAGSAAANCSLTQDRAGIARNTFASASDSDLVPLIQAWQATTSKSMQFSVDRTGDTGVTAATHVFMPQLACVVNPVHWLDPKASSHVNLTFVLPVWSFKSQIDPSYRLRAKPAAVDEVSVSLAFDASVLAKTGTVTGQAISTVRSTGQSTTMNKFVIVECKP